MITAYGGPPMLDLDQLVPLQVPQGIIQRIQKLPTGFGPIEEISRRWHSDTTNLVLARGLSHVVTDIGAGHRKIIQRIEVFPQTSDAVTLTELRGLAASREVQLRVGDDLVYRCPLAGVLTLDSALAQRLATLEARLAAYEAELTGKLSSAGGGEQTVMAVPDGNDSFMRIATPIDLDEGQRLEVSLVGLGTGSISAAVNCTLTIALHGHASIPVAASTLSANTP